MKRKYPEGPRINLALAIIAQMFPQRFPFDPLAFGLDNARLFGDIAYYKAGPLHVYQLNHPDLARQVLVERPERFHKASLVKRGLRPFAGEGLVTSDGALWRQQRKLIQPAFHHRHLAAYAEVMTANTRSMLDSFVPGEVREIHTEMTALTFGIVMKTLFGADLPVDGSQIRRLMQAVLEAANLRMNGALRLPDWFPTPRHLREKRAVAELDRIVQSLVRSRLASAESRDDLLSLLLAAADEESGARMSHRQLRDEIMTLFLAGHDTTANALTWTFYLLSRHPEVEAKLVDELHRVLAGRTPSAADLPNLPYTEMVIRESLRLYPPAAAVAREPLEEINLGGFNIAKGSLLLVHIYAMHNDERFFPNPERFDPERFAPGWEERVPRHAYLPFGGGPRVCIGNGFASMEARLILATVAQAWRFRLESGEIRPLQVVTVKPGGPVRMRMERRSNCETV